MIEGEFSGTVIKGLSKNKNIKGKELSKDFIMEEIAMFSSLTCRDYSTRISKYKNSESISFFLKRKNLYLKHIQLN